MRGFLLNRSILLEKYRSQQIFSKVKHLVSSHDFEFILCSELSAMQYVQEIASAIPVFFDDHNVEHDLIRQSAELFPPPLRQLILRESMKIKTEELASVRMAEKTFAVSDLDREALWWDPILTINNTFADGWWLYKDLLSDDPTIIFVGNISWKPNLLWLIHFIEKVFPKILGVIPNAKFVIAGSNAPESIKNIAKAHGNITLSENVSEEDKIRLINRAWIGIAPLYFGWGTRIKILEYWSYWKTVVSTQKWAEWLRSSEWTIIAYSDDEFADWITKILVNPQLLQEYWKENYSTFLSYYSFEKVYAHTLYNALSTKRPQ
jgi:polysaccharide biosynthesis protein PslH